MSCFTIFGISCLSGFKHTRKSTEPTDYFRLVCKTLRRSGNHPRTKAERQAREPSTAR